MSKIGITGATGFVGQWLLRELAGRHELVAAVRQGGKPPPARPGLAVCAADFSAQGLARAFAGCDAVVHLAARRPAAGEGDSITAYYDSITLAENLFAACEMAGIANVVHFSSISVYPETGGSVWRETDAPQPRSRYGAAKLCAEAVAGLYNLRGVHIKSLRVAQIIGCGERGGYMPAAFLQACLDEKPLEVYGRGLEFREYVYIRDVCRAVWCALESPEAGGVYNIGGLGAVNNLRLAQAYCRAFGNTAGVRMRADKAEKGMAERFDTAKAERELGYRPIYTLETALEDLRRAVVSGNGC